MNEKANELVEKFSDLEDGEMYIGKAKQCSLIAVDEIINTLSCHIRDLDVRGSVLLDLIQYWREVKQELLKIK